MRPRLEALVDALFQGVPSGVGSKGKIIIDPLEEMDQVLTGGAEWAVAQGFGAPEDLPVTEEGGRIPGAAPSTVGSRTRQRGAAQMGTLGYGNHFLEVQMVDEVYDVKVAERFGITGSGQITVMLHCGSRGFGHQVCDDYIDDYIKVAEGAAQCHGIRLPDRQLAAALISSQESENYLNAMRCAANYAWANRQCIAHWTREAFEQVFGLDWRDMGIHRVYDVAHNMAKIETHVVGGEEVDYASIARGPRGRFQWGALACRRSTWAWGNRCSSPEI